MSGWAPHDPGPHWGEVGIHGLHRQREWDDVHVVEATTDPVGEGYVVVLADGRVVVEDGEPGPALASLLEGVRATPPFRAWIVPRADGRVGVAARAIELVELADDPGGDEVEVVWDGTERTVRIDGEPSPRSVVELDRLGRHRRGAYAVTARRVEGRVWEVLVASL